MAFFLVVTCELMPARPSLTWLEWIPGGGPESSRTASGERDKKVLSPNQVMLF